MFGESLIDGEEGQIHILGSDVLYAFGKFTLERSDSRIKLFKCFFALRHLSLYYN